MNYIEDFPSLGERDCMRRLSVSSSSYVHGKQLPDGKFRDSPSPLPPVKNSPGQMNICSDFEKENALMQTAADQDVNRAIFKRRPSHSRVEKIKEDYYHESYPGITSPRMKKPADEEFTSSENVFTFSMDDLK